MGNNASKRAILIEHYPIGAWTATVIFLKIIENRELLVGSGHIELKVLVVTKRVRILAGSLGLTGLEELEPFRHGSRHGALEIADVATGRGACLGLAFAEERICCFGCRWLILRRVE